MTSCSPTRRWTLSKVLGDKEVQRQVISRAADSLFELSQQKGSPSLVGSRENRPEKKMRGITVAALMESAPEAVNRGPQIAGYMQSVATCEQDALTLAWCAIAAMVLFPACAKEVAAATPIGWAPYFEGRRGLPPLSDRVVGLLMGDATRAAMTPMQVVLAEWQLFDRLAL